MKIVSALSISLLYAVSSFAMEQQSPSQIHTLSFDTAVPASLLTLPRDMKVYIITYLTAEHSKTTAGKLAAAVKNIHAIAAVNKEFHSIINDPLVMEILIERLEAQCNHHILDIACAIGTSASVQGFEALRKKWHPKLDLFLWAEGLCNDNNKKGLKFFLKAVQQGIIDYESIEDLLHGNLLKPDIIAILLDYPDIQVNKNARWNDKTPLFYAKNLLREWWAINDPQRKAALRQTIELLEKNGATEMYIRNGKS